MPPDRRMLRDRGTLVAMDLKQSTRPLVMPDNVIDLAYLAGIFDGEGSITTKNHKGRQYRAVTVANCDRALISWLGSLGGGITITSHPRTDTRTCYSWYVAKQPEVVLFLETLMPYLMIKRERALEAIEKIHTLPSMQGRLRATG